jgi:CDP-glycerol glycerophosphotransferase (TagB/SpsB family)
MGATLDYSTFLTYADLMLEIANQYKDNIQIAFKPHPILRSKLSKEEIWGKAKTDKYYHKWEILPNGHLFEGEYIDLFLTSDGMIHDCGSFLIEYLYTNNPVMYILNDDSISDRLNDIGKMALSNHYHGKNNLDIDNFLNNVILSDNDYMSNERKLFFNSIIKPPNNVTASENIFNYLESVLFCKEENNL